MQLDTVSLSNILKERKKRFDWTMAAHDSLDVFTYHNDTAFNCTDGSLEDQPSERLQSYAAEGCVMSPRCF